MRVAELEERLLARFPREDAEEWDRVGLSVGDPGEEISGIACALDPTREAVCAAARAGANVLLTHHPVYLEAPRVITPDAAQSSAGAALWAAIERGVSLIALHTNLDRSEEALRFIAKELELPYLGRACAEGYGALLDGSEIDLHELGKRLERKLGALPVLWSARTCVLPSDIHKKHIDFAGADDEGKPADSASRLCFPPHVMAGSVAYLSGSAGGLALDAAAHGARTIVCGEDSYHRLIELINRKTTNNDNINAIVIGHDVSELPYARLLGRVARELAPGVSVRVLDEGIHWYPM